MFITKKHLPRRAVLRGIGVSLALPFLESMVPPLMSFSEKRAPARTRFVAIEMVHGAAGSTAIGRAKNYWSPATEGSDFQISQTLKSLEPFREYLTIVSNTELQNAMALAPGEDGPMADHARSSSVFLTGAHPKMTAGSDFQAGSSIDQIYAQHVGQETAIPSLQLCIENVGGLTGACSLDYSCAYTNTISWASPTKPLPMQSDPRAVFERIVGRTKSKSGSILDTILEQATGLRNQLGNGDRLRMDEYLEDVRDVEQRIQKVEKENASGTTGALPGFPISIPQSFEDHVKLMFDLQLLAFAGDVTRVVSFKMSIDRSNRIYPESGITTPFHTLSHHREDPEKIEQFAELNQYHVSLVARFLVRLRDTREGDGNLLDQSVVLYGSPMGDSHVHGHKFLPVFLVGKANGELRGNTHRKCADGTSLSNVLLTLLHKLGVPLDRIGDSTGEVSI